MTRTALTLATAAFAAPLGAQQTVQLPWAVAEGGVVYEVTVDGDIRSQHSTLHGALREAGVQAVGCTDCAVTIEHVQRWWIELRSVTLPDDSDPEPEPDPEPEAWTVERSELLWPQEILLESLGEHEVRWIFVSWGSDGASYAPVQLSDWSVAWVEVRIEGEGEDTELWVDPQPRTHDHLEVGMVLTIPENDVLDPGEMTLVYRLDELPQESPVMLGQLWGLEERESGVQAADLPAPGLPTFEATQDGALVSWTPSEGADAYRVQWPGDDVITDGPPQGVEGLETGDWACIWPRVGGEEGPMYRCNTWRTE